MSCEGQENQKPDSRSLVLMSIAYGPECGLAVGTGGAVKLQKAGLIRYGRGRISVLDRTGLERAACECYPVVERACEGILHDWVPHALSPVSHLRLAAISLPSAPTLFQVGEVPCSAPRTSGYRWSEQGLG